MKSYYISALLLLLGIISYSQQQDFEYCQIAAHGDRADDPHVNKFLFGKSHVDYADSLLTAFKAKYLNQARPGLSMRNRHYYVTDALNFMKSLGWELETVYTVPPTRTFNGLTSNALFFYVLKRKATL